MYATAVCKNCPTCPLRYIRRVRALLRGLVCAVLATRVASAGGLVTSSSPRSIGRAGATTVGDDGGGALLANPAAIARRGGKRGELGVVFVDDELSWQSDTAGAPIVRDQSASNVAPHAAAFASVDAWTFGLAAMTTSVSRRSFRRPSDVPNPSDIDQAFDYRYAGIAGSYRRDTATLGVARRIGDELAIGLSFAGSRVAFTEVRRMWAGFEDRNDTVGDAAHDLELGFSGDDVFVPSAVAGLLYAPEDTPLELGLSVAWSGKARIDADVFGSGTRPLGPSASPDHATATIALPQPIIVRAGTRYLAERYVIELGGELARVGHDAESNSWAVHGMRVVDGPTGLDVPLETVPSRWSMRTHGAIRGAADIAIFPGFLWGTLGYAHVIGSVTGKKLSPTFGDLGGETLGLGIEGKAGGFTVTLGWSRTWSATRHIPHSALALDNPFDAGDSPVPGGTFDGSIDQIGILIDAELDPPSL